MTDRIARITEADRGPGLQVTEAILGAGVTVVRVSPSIRQSDFDGPNFMALPTALTGLDSAKRAQMPQRPARS